MAAPKPTSKADVDPVFEANVNRLADAARDEGEARRRGNQVKWDRPEGWNGDVFAWQAMEEPFDRSASNGAFVDATANADAPGTTGDLVLATTQIDLLAAMERAFRARHAATRARNGAHLAGRKAGAGAPRGALRVRWLEYARALAQMAKAGEDRL